MEWDEPRLRRAWLRGFRAGDVELALAQFRLERMGLQQELDAARNRLDDVAAEGRELRERDAAGGGREVVLDAEARAAEVRSEALRRVEEIQRQTDELMALRQRLVANVRHAVDEVDAVVRAVETDVPPARPLVADLASRT